MKRAEREQRRIMPAKCDSNDESNDSEIFDYVFQQFFAFSLVFIRFSLTGILMSVRSVFAYK
jgi:hypothetical protein